MLDKPIQFAAYRLMLASILSAMVFGVTLAAGGPAAKAALYTAAIALAVFSLLAVRQVAVQGSAIDAKRQVILLLSVEFLFVPLAMTAATVGYFWDKLVAHFVV